MRKGLVGFIAFFLLLVPTQFVNAASIKAGASCTKLGQSQVVNGYNFTCIKFGKKLIWDKGVVIKKPSLTPSASPAASTSPAASASPIPSASPTTSTNLNFSPWGTVFETQQMINAALNATNAFFGKVNSNNDYEITVDSNLSMSDQSWIRRVLDYANGSFSFLKREKLRIFLGTSHEWSLKTLRAANLWVGDPSSPYPCSQGLHDAYCADNNFILLIYSDIYGPNSATYGWDMGRRSTPAHELFHTVQFALAGPNVGTESPLHIPRWLMEGSANFFGFYVADKLGFDIYETGRKQQVNNNLSYKTVVPLINYDSFNLDPYGIGQAASEYLIASIGFENFLNIWKFTKSEGNFAEGFRKATGIKIEDFYSKFEVARNSMHIGN